MSIRYLVELVLLLLFRLNHLTNIVVLSKVNHYAGEETYHHATEHRLRSVHKKGYALCSLSIVSCSWCWRNRRRGFAGWLQCWRCWRSYTRRNQDEDESFQPIPYLQQDNSSCVLRQKKEIVVEVVECVWWEKWLIKNDENDDDDEEVDEKNITTTDDNENEDDNNIASKTKKWLLEL